MRRIGLFLVVGVVLPLVVTASASAQGAVLQVTPESAAPGDTVSVSGSGYNQSSATTGGIDIRFDRRDAEPVASTSADSAGRIGPLQFRVPAGLTAGEHLIIATQLSVRGRQTFGGPGRARLRVTGPRAATASGPPASAPPGGAAGHATTALGAAFLALLLLAGGTLAAGRLRTLNRPLGG